MGLSTVKEQETEKLAESLDRRINEVISIDKTAISLLTNHLMANFNIEPK